MRFGQPVPESLRSPDLHDIEQDIWVSFWDLNSERWEGGPLVWRSIREYGKILGIEPGLFNKLIRQMDNVYLSHKAGDGKTFSRDMLRK